MAISYPLTFPTNKQPSEVTFGGMSAVAVSESPFTFDRQVQVHAGQRWMARITMPIMTRADAEEFNSFLMKLNGQQGTFLLGDPAATTPRGSASTTPGTPVVNGAEQTGNTLTMDGAPISATGYLLAGDYIQLSSGASSRLHKVLEDVNTDGSGGATLTIWPSLRTSPADNATIVVSSAKGVFRLSSNRIEWAVIPHEFYNIKFDAVEAL